MKVYILLAVLCFLKGVRSDAMASKIYDDDDGSSPSNAEEKAAALLAEQNTGEGRIEGDMRKNIYRSVPERTSPIASTDREFIKSPVVHYLFDDGLAQTAKDAALAACKYLSKYTCVQCQEGEDSNRNYIRFASGEGCYNEEDGVRDHNMRKIVIGTRCHYKGSVLHQMMHAFGFLHEHTREDRDQYIKINMEAISEAGKNKFARHSYPAVTDLPYDYNSIMHFPSDAYKKDDADADKKTIEIKKKKIGGEIGQRRGLSACDIVQVVKAFRCEGKKSFSEKEELFKKIKDNCYEGFSGSSTGLNLFGTTSELSADDLEALPDKVKVPKNVAAIVTTTKTQRVILGPAKPHDAEDADGDTVLYPVWPEDFSLSGDESCGCDDCNCNCVEIDKVEDEADESDATEKEKRRKKHFLCNKKRKHVTGIEYSSKGPLKDKRCTTFLSPKFGKNWKNKVLCVARDSPYFFQWSPNGQTNPKLVSCLRMNVPNKAGFICAKNTKQN